MRESLNVLGRKLEPCSGTPLTGFYRDGCCNTGPEDFGAHIVCTQVTAEFLEFSKATGNDLSTPHPEWLFPGLKPGDRWCVCASRWMEAYEAGVIGPVYLEGTHIALLEFISLAELKKHAVTN
ncbi:DUF2237 domain-containing protein [Candidatus Sumerlaeota bacterium]|nr:DUF2237 domain-containing protein [Candidatus Sumerlaeota bacterium]